ncbi:MAG TPA: hypothetical protein VMO00_01790 [Methylomirabilota bacterium]|nr:hypothetical protein [Methylomirabilota bacterium]
MNFKQKLSILFLGAALTTPALVFAQEKTLPVTIVSKSAKEIKVKTKGAGGWSDKTFIFDSKTKGIENAKEGSKVTVKYLEKDGQLKAIEINPR